MSIKFQKLSTEEIKGLIDVLDPELRTRMESEEAANFLKISFSIL
jgi:hypothetical protein